MYVFQCLLTRLFYIANMLGASCGLPACLPLSACLCVLLLSACLLFVCLSACPCFHHFYLPACICLSVCLYVCMSACPPACLPASVYLFVSLSVCLRLPICLSVPPCLSVCLPACTGDVGHLLRRPCCSGSQVSLALSQGLPNNGEPGTVAMYAFALVLMNCLGTWAAPACNNPAFAEIVPPHMRNIIFAFDRCFEGAIAACAAPLVGTLAERQFGFTVSQMIHSS